MSSILKVDTIQDQSGNNIISEAANVITIGASGDTITVPAGATVSGFTSAGIDDNATSTAITISSGEDVTFTENILLGDNKKAKFGTGNDLEIYHTGTQSVISDVGSGNLNLEGDAKIVLRSSGGSENYAQFFKDGAVELYHDNSKKFETTSAGATVTGTATVTGGLTVDTNTLFVDSSNNRVGIGTTSPGFEFEVKDASGPSVIRVNNGGDNKIVDLIADSTGGLLRTIGSYPLVLNTNQTERMRILSDGNVGIGTSSPGTKLDVVGTIGVESGNSYRFGNNANTRIEGSNAVNVRLGFFTGGSERVRIDASGNVGVGTTSPSQPLDVLGSAQISFSSGVNTYQYFQSTSNFIGRKTDGNLNIGVAGSQSIVSSVGGSEKMRITSAGKVGIGTSSADYLLTVGSNNSGGQGNASSQRQAHFSTDFSTEYNPASSSTWSGISVHNSNTSSTRTSTGITFISRSGSSGLAAILSTNDGSLERGDLRFITRGDGNVVGERMRIDDNGNVGIGTASPGAKLHVVNTGGQAAKIHSDTNNSGDLGMSILAGLDTPSSSGDCKWVRLADGNDSGKAYIQFKSSSPNAEFAAISDERLKTNIQNTDVVGLDVINNLRLVKFDWNETATQNAGWSMHGHQKLGFVAQEVEAIVPEFISEDINGFKIMGDSGFVPYLIKAMQEQQIKIQELEARITTLEANNP